MRISFFLKIALAMVIALGAADVAEATVANSRTGEVSGNYRVRAFDRHTFTTISFYGGERAQVYVSGDGDTDLDLYVYDRFGNLVASDDDYTDECLVRFTPRYTGVYRIVVVNRGDVYNDYYLSAS